MRFDHPEAVSAPLRELRKLTANPARGEEHVSRLEAVYRAEGPNGLPPIVVYTSPTGAPLTLGDGNHRLTAARRLGLRALPALFRSLEPTVARQPGPEPSRFAVEAAAQRRARAALEGPRRA